MNCLQMKKETMKQDNNLIPLSGSSYGSRAGSWKLEVKYVAVGKKAAVLFSEVYGHTFQPYFTLKINSFVVPQTQH